jgi:hypothetical protein
MDISEFPEIAAAHQGAAHLSVVQGRQRLVVQAFIAEQFARAHQARIKHFMPVLLSLNAADGALAMACGLRAAAASDLFLEQYLNQPVEAVLTAAAGKPITRNSIVEVGNLAVSAETPARQLIIALTRYLATTPMQWVVCTVLPQLRNSFTRLGIAHHALGAARLESLALAERADWGNYYENQPTVIAINVAAALRAIDLREKSTA